MKNSSRQDYGKGEITEKGAQGPQGAGYEREVALQRVMVYLRALSLPPVLSLELALEALRKAGEGWSLEREGNLAGFTMQTLWQILASRGIGFTGPGGGPAQEGETIVAVMPPLCRHPMIPEELDRRPWITAVVSGFRQARTWGLKSSKVRYILYLILLGAVLGYLLVKLG